MGLLVEGLAQAIMEKGDEKYAVDFWKTLVRNFPSSWCISDALGSAFTANGDDQAAMQFWGRMRRVGPKEQHFAYFYVESCKNAGKFEEAIKIWWLWLHHFLSGVKPERDIFSPETIVDSLNVAMKFDHDLPEIIEIWEASLNEYPVKEWPDARQKCMATALLEYSNNFLPHTAHEHLQKAAEISPDHEEITRQLRATFKTTGTSNFEENFWRSRLISTDYLSGSQGDWYYVRLAQFYSGVYRYEDVKYCIKRVAESNPGGITGTVWDVLKNLNVGSNAREFWRLMVETTPVWNFVDQLESACNQLQSSSSSDIRMWQSLTLRNLSDDKLSFKLLSAFQKERKRDPQKIEEEIGFWKQCIRMNLRQSEHLCRGLADAYKWKREHDIRDASTAFDEEISMWKTLLLEQAPEYAVGWGDYGIPGHLDKAIKAKADAIGDNLESVLEVWKSARELWQVIGFQFIGGSLEEVKPEIKNHIDDASAIVQLLEHHSRI